jgi:putative CocE/NonD family hydrolase
MRWVGSCVFLTLWQPLAVAQELAFRAPASAGDPAVPAIMRDLAARMLPVYQDGNQERFLDNLSALQSVTGDHGAAFATRQSLIGRRRQSSDSALAARATAYDIYIRARAIEREARVPFPQAFVLAFRRMVPRLEDREAYVLIGRLANSVPELREALQREFDQVRGKGRISMPEALDLLWAYATYDAHRHFHPLINALDTEESRRRYVTESVLIRMKQGASISAVVVRPKLLKKMPALLEFSIEDAQNDGKESASYGYVGVMAYSRGTHGGSGEVAPFIHDGDDARGVIAWITKQAWSNGTVGMYGGGYSGFSAFAAASRKLPALKAIAVSDPTAPGIDFPMAGGIFRNAAYRWAFQATNTTGLSEKVFDDDKQWRQFNHSWYSNGGSYRELVASVSGPQIDLVNRWLNHPSYDAYWRKLVPDQAEFSGMDIPVLTITGYYSAAQSGALHYFSEHHRSNARADHTLVMGPYDERSMQYGPSAVLKGYRLDPAALVSLRELRYQWFDHVLKGDPKPALLGGRINHQVMGRNEWRARPALPEAGKGSVKFFLEPSPGGDRNRLLERKSAQPAFLPQMFDLADRDDVNRPPQPGVLSRNLAKTDGEVFVSEPLPRALEIGGELTGQLDFTVNKMDMDVSIALYEQLPSGEYLALLDPPFDFRASYARDRSTRRLLKAGMRQQLAFRSERFTSRLLQAGSRVVVVLGISKRPDRQINYGTGDDVSVESIDDARVPLRIRWYNGSYVELPTMNRQTP